MHGNNKTTVIIANSYLELLLCQGTIVSTFFTYIDPFNPHDYPVGKIYYAHFQKMN